MHTITHKILMVQISTISSTADIPHFKYTSLKPQLEPFSCVTQWRFWIVYLFFSFAFQLLAFESFETWVMKGDGWIKHKPSAVWAPVSHPVAKEARITAARTAWSEAGRASTVTMVLDCLGRTACETFELARTLLVYLYSRMLFEQASSSAANGRDTW